MDSNQDLQIDNDHKFIVEAYKTFLIIAHDKKYDSIIFLDQVNFIKQYPRIFNNLNLLAEFANKLFQHIMLHKETNLAACVQNLEQGHPVDTQKLTHELKFKSYRTNILHFFLTILKLKVNNNPNVLEILSCTKIYNITLLLICNDNIPFANRLSLLLRENRLPLSECVIYLNEVNRLHKLLNNMWPTFKKTMTEYVLTSKEAIADYDEQFGGKSFLDCYIGICDLRWQYMNLLFKLSAIITEKYCAETNHIITHLFEIDHAIIVEKFKLNAIESEAALTALEERIKLVKNENESILSASEIIQISAYQYYLQHVEKVEELIFNLNNNSHKINTQKIENLDVYKTLVTVTLLNIEKLLAKKNNLSLENYQKTISLFLSLNNYSHTHQLVELMPSMIKINNLWLENFRMQDFSLVTKILLDKHEWLKKSFSTILQHKKDTQLKYIKNFVTDIISFSKNITPDKVESNDSEKLADGFIALHKDSLDHNNAHMDVHEMFIEMMDDLEIQAEKVSSEHMRKCKPEDSLYEISRFTVGYSMQRINNKCFYITHLLSKLGFTSQKYYCELAKHRLFTEVFSLGNIISSMLLNGQVPNEKQAGLYQKLDMLSLLEKKYWAEQSKSMFQHISNYAKSNPELKNILDIFKSELWNQNVNALLFKSRYARLKAINKDNNSAQHLNSAQKEKIAFEHKQNFYAQFSNIEKEDFEIDLNKIKEEFDLLVPKVEIQTKPITPTKSTPVIKEKKTSAKSETLIIKSSLPPKSELKRSLSEPKPVIQNKPIQLVVSSKPKPKKKPLHKTISTEITAEDIAPKLTSITYDIEQFMHIPAQLNKSITPKPKSEKKYPEKILTKIEPKITFEESIARFKTNEIIHLDNELKIALSSLTQEDAIAYVQGGYVRDKLLNRTPNDADIITNLEPNRIMEIMDSLGYTCKFADKLKEVTLFTCRKKDGKGINIDIKYSTLPIEAEIQKSDLTINSFVCFADGIVLDFLNAIQDLQESNLKMVGNYDAKFKEDPKRTLRLIRFAVELDKLIPDNYIESIKNNNINANALPYNVYLEHVKKLFLTGSAKKCLGILMQYNLLSVFETSLSNAIFDEQKDLLVFLNWTFMHIDNDIKINKSNKDYKSENIIALFLLPALIMSKHFIIFYNETNQKTNLIKEKIKSTAEEIVEKFMTLQGRDIDLSNKHMIRTRIMNELIRFYEKYSSVQEHMPLHDMTNECIPSPLLTYQFSNLKLNNTTDSSNDGKLIHPLFCKITHK